MKSGLALIVILAAIRGYLSGVQGSATIVATTVSARAMPPRAALLLAAVGILIGPLVLGVAVAATIASDLITPIARTESVVIAALTATIIWNFITLRLHIPSSFSQTLVGCLLGPVWAGYGTKAILLPGLIKALAGLFLSPVLGLIGGYLLCSMMWTVGQYASPRINRSLNRAQIFFSLMVALTFGANEAQKIMAMVVLGLFAVGSIHAFVVPIWVILLSAVSMATGAFVGGHQLIRTLGGKFYKIRPIEGFSAQVASSIIIFLAGMFGGPVSGSQVVTSAIIGAGSADRIQKVRWHEVNRILIGWVVTIPLSALLSAGLYESLKLLGGIHT